MDINAASAIVSGGASGLGEATARTLAGAGATVTVAEPFAHQGKTLADELGAQFAQCNVVDDVAVPAAVEAAAGAGPPRIAVSRAGIGWASRVIGRDGSSHDMGASKQVVEVNV